MSRPTLYEDGEKRSRSYSVTEFTHRWLLEQTKNNKLRNIGEYLEKLARSEIKPVKIAKTEKPSYSDREWNKLYNDSQQLWSEIKDEIKLYLIKRGRTKQQWYGYIKKFICMTVDMPIEKSKNADYLLDWSKEQLQIRYIYLKNLKRDLIAYTSGNMSDKISKEFDLDISLIFTYRSLVKDNPETPKIDQSQLIVPMGSITTTF